MKSKRLVVLIGIIGILVLATLACRFSLPGVGEGVGDEIGEVYSADGSAILEIPLSALPRGTKIDDISIELVSSPSDDESEAARWIYNLSPDGLSFSQPITLNLSYDLGDELPAFSAGITQISDNGEVEILESNHITHHNGFTFHWLFTQY